MISLGKRKLVRLRIVPRTWPLTAALLGATLLLSCTLRHTRAAVPSAPLTLTLVDALVWPSTPGGSGRSDVIGSLSGLTRDPRSGHYVAVIDDGALSRIAGFDIQWNGRLQVTPQFVMPTRPGAGVDARLVQHADLEAIVALGDGRFVATEEGHRFQPPPGLAGAVSGRGRVTGDWPTSFLTLTEDGVVSQVWPWGVPFGLGDASGGVRDNQGAEALARWPDGRLVAGLEQPLYRDASASPRNGRPFGGGQGGLSRLVEWRPTATGWRLGRQWAYPLAATPPREGYAGICDDGELGLVELLALGADRLLSLERACLINPETRRVRNVIQIFEVRLDGADDVSGRSLLGATGIRTASKRLVLDLDTMRASLPEALALLDNFEAMAEGPTLPDGRRTVVLVSDDNFRQTQVTAFLLLALS